MRRTKWFPTVKERKEYEEKCRIEMEKALAAANVQIVKLPDGPKPRAWCDVKSKTFTNNGAKLSPDEAWLVGGKKRD